MPFVSLCLSSAELGLKKPDPEIFQLALSQSGCEPEQAVMIGDRLDNDIRPARLQGWKTIGLCKASRDSSHQGIASTRQISQWQI